MKRKEKAVRRFMALLAAVCMLGSMPDLSVVSHAAENGKESLETYDAGADGQEEFSEEFDLNEQADSMEQEEGEAAKGAEKQGDTEERDTGESEGKKNAEESEEKEDTEDTEENGTEESKDKEGTGESGAEGTDKEGTSEEGDSDGEEKTEETPEGETDLEDEEADTGEEADEEEEDAEAEETGEEDDAEAEETGEEDDTEAEEIEEEGVMLLAAQAEGSVQVDSTYTDANGVIYHYYGYDDGTAEIYELEDYKESTWDYKALDIPANIGGYAVARLTFTVSSDVPWFPSVTIPETVTYMEGSLFKRMKIETLHYNAENAVTGATSESTGVFFQANIQELHIGENVKAIPDYCFDAAKITMDTLTLNVESIGRKAFYYDKMITTLTIGENVKEVGYQAFMGNEIENINYNAVNAAQSAQYGQLVSGPFGGISVSGITIGDQVTMIPEHLFCNIRYTADTLVFPDCLTTVGAWAFYGNNIDIGELTVGENVVSIGEESFARGNIGILNYNAVDARLDGVTESNKHRTSFEGAEIGELRIGERVESLPDTLFYDISLVQDTLVLPDGITYIGSYVLSYSGGKVKIDTLEIGENVAHIGRAAFGCNTYDRVVVRTVEADSPPKSDFEIELPVCKEIEIHGESPYYDFFTKNTDKDHITLLCEDFETIRGEEYYDAGKKSFVTPITEACTVCGYGETREEYSEACTVIFTDYNGRELSRQNLHKGDDATAPEEPERTGYLFTGWDKDFTNVTSDLTVRAEYEVQKFSVVFKDGDRIISEQEVSYEDSAEVPENPTRPEEEWGSWRFTGWSGNYTNVTKDEVVTAQFEKVLNQYEVLFYDAEGNVISRQTIAHGEAAEAPEAPKKEPTAQYHYTFTGWSADTEGITGNTAFYPVYEAETRSYTVTFMNGSTVLGTQTVEYGDDAVAPEAPTRPEEEWGRWEFTGWSGSYTNITKDEVIRAVFEKILNEYEVIFYDADDNILSRQTVKHGMGAEAPEAPEIEPTERECYVFVGWDGDVSNITGESRFRPVYETKTRTYTVTFMNGDTSYDVQEVEYGASAVTPPDPSKEEDKDYTYRFVGWDQDYSFITGDLTVRAVFEQVEKPKEDDPGEEKPKEDDPDEEKPKEEDKDKEKPKDKDTDGEKPGGGDGDDGQKPGDGDDGRESDGGTGTDGGQPDGEPAGDDGGEPVVSTPEVPAKKKIPPLVTLPQTVCGEKPAVPASEISEESAGTEETEAEVWEEKSGEQEMPQEAEDTGAKWHMPGWLWLLLLSGTGGGVFVIWLWLFCRGKRTVRGTVLDGDENAVCGVKVSLIGSEDEMMEVQTDEDGQYIFEGLDKGDYRLCLFGEEETVTLLMDIRMGVRDRKKVFSILKSDADNVETDRSGKKYRVDVTV